MISTSTNLYVIGSDGGPLKVGLAKNCSDRAICLQTGNSRKLRVYFSAPVPLEIARKVELRAHWLLRESQEHGEWFTVSPETAKEAVTSAIACGGEGERARPSVGRRRINDEQTPARFPEGTLARIDSVLEDKEKRSDFIREAVDKEILRRLTLKAKQGQAFARIKGSPPNPRAKATLKDAE